MKRKFCNIFEYVDNFSRYNNVKSLCIKDSLLPEVPELSIVIPTYRRVKTLKYAIDSALKQDYEKSYEVVVLDNNPERNDETEQFVMTHYKDVDCLAYYKNEENMGMTGNWNRMYEVAKAEWVSMLHDDDILFPCAMRIGMSVTRNIKLIDALFLTHTLDGNYSYDACPHGSYAKLYPFDFRIENMGDVVGTLIKKEIVLKLGGFNNDYYPSSDYHFWALLSLKANVYRLFGDPLGYYRIEVNTASKIESLEGFVKIDYILMNGLLSESKFNGVRKYIYSKYIQEYLLLLIDSWRTYFRFDGEKNEIDRIAEKYKLVDSRINRAVYWIYNKSHKLLLRIRKHPYLFFN